MNKCFLLNPKRKIGTDCLVVFEKNEKKTPLILKNDVTEPKNRLF